MDYYEEARQYNALEFETFKYPTRTHLVQGQSPKAKGLRFTELRERPNIDVGMMPYQDQKEFFRLDREHDNCLLEQHEWKNKRTTNKLDKALMANLNRERTIIFKQFMNERKRQNIQMNSLCMSSRIPRTSLTDKAAALKNNRFVRATQEVISSAYRPDILGNETQRRFDASSIHGYRKIQGISSALASNQSPRQTTRESTMNQAIASPKTPHSMLLKQRASPASSNFAPVSQLQQYNKLRMTQIGRNSHQQNTSRNQPQGGANSSLHGITGGSSLSWSRTPNNAAARNKKIFKGIPSRQQNGTFNHSTQPRSGIVVNSG